MMTKNLIALSLLTFTFSEVAQAQARKYSNCPGLGQITEPPLSTGYYLDTSCQTVYVLPPKTGLISVTGFTAEIGANNEICRNLNGNLQSIDQNLREARRSLDLNNELLSQTRSDRADLAVACVGYVSDTATVLQNVNAQQEKITAEQAKNADLVAKIATCTETTCATLGFQKQTSDQKLASLGIQADFLASKYSRYKAKSEACVTKQTNRDHALALTETHFTTEISRLTLLIAEGTAKTQSYYTSMRDITGGLLAGNISSEQETLVNDFKEANYSLKDTVSFVAMPMNEGSLNFTQLKQSDSDEYPIAKFITVLGVNAIQTNDGVQSGRLTNNNTSSPIVFGAAVGFQMGINLFGACQLAARSSYQAGAHSANGLAGMLAGTVTYKYQLGVTRSIKVKYNEKQLYCLIKKNTVSNGFFKSSSASSIAEDSQLNRWLQVEIENQDSAADFVNHDKLLLDLRREYLDRALINVARSYLTKEQAKMLDPGHQGAADMASELRKCPDLYCQIGAFALDLGSALFGGTETTSSNCSTVGAMVDDVLIDKTTVSAFTTQSFKVQESY